MRYEGFTWSQQVEVNVRDLGGRGDGRTDNTAVLQQAIDQVAAQASALCQGIVMVPAGTWLTGPIELKSYVTLRLDAETTLKALPEPTRFKAAYIGAPFAPGEALIYAHHATHCGIESWNKEGAAAATIDGNGATWWPQAQEARTWLKNGEVERFTQAFPGVVTANGMPRPWLIEFSECSEVELKHLAITNSPMWTVVLRNCERVLIEQVNITNPESAPNTDGIDVVSSRDVTITGCTVDTGDDNIAIKSGLKQDGAPRSERILIDDFYFEQGHGLSVGSETANGIGAVTVARGTFERTGTGIRVKTARDRGNQIGPLEVRQVKMQQVETPLLLTCSYAGQSGVGDDAVMEALVAPLEAAEPSATTPYVHDITLEDVTAREAKFGLVLSGLPEAPLTGVTLRNVKVESRYGLAARYVTGALVNCDIKASQGEPLRFGPECALEVRTEA